MYVLQLNPAAPYARCFNIQWAGFWSGMGYVDKKKNAVKFPTRRDAALAACGTLIGLNGCFNIVKVKTR